MKNGEKVTYWVPEDIYRMMKNMDAPQMEGIGKFLQGAGSVFRAGTTRFSIPFIATSNLAMDVPTMLLQTQARSMTQAVRALAEGLGSAFYRGKGWKDALYSRAQEIVAAKNAEKLTSERQLQSKEEAELRKRFGL